MQFSQILAKFAVSLFTREWIEMLMDFSFSALSCVSLFTREWIEINYDMGYGMSESGLPLYEGVD